MRPFYNLRALSSIACATGYWRISGQNGTNVGLQGLRGLVSVDFDRFRPFIQGYAHTVSLRMNEAEVPLPEHAQEVPLELEEGAAFVLYFVPHRNGVYGRQVLRVAEVAYITSASAANEAVADGGDIHAE